MPFHIKIAVLSVLGVISLVFVREMFLLIDLLRCSRRKEISKSRIFSKPAIVFHVLAVIGLLCFGYGMLIEPYWLDVNEIAISTDKLGDVKLRVVQISDLHCDMKIRNEKKLIEIINAAEPDIIVFTGDAINSREAGPIFRQTMRSLKAKIAKLAVEGNWDGGTTKDNLIKGTGFEILDRQNRRFEKDGQEFYISGLTFGDGEYTDQLLSTNSPEIFNILLYHSPDLIEDVAKYNVDLYLAGHTHGGQIALPFYGAVLTFSKFGKKYESGLYRVGKTDLYVNRGVGMEGGTAPRARFFARPEIAIFDIGGKNFATEEGEEKRAKR